MNKEAPVIIARVAAESEASVIKSLLEGYDIPCHYAAGLPNRFYPLPEPDSAHIKIFVPAAFEQAARDILEEHRRDSSSLHPVDD